MLRRTILALPRYDKGYTEVQHRGRRLHLFPSRNPLAFRKDLYTDRFREVGPARATVWLSLGPKMRRRRMGRDRDVNDLRYYWRPIPKATQVLYTQAFRRQIHYNKNVPQPRLFATPSEIGGQTSSSLFDGKIDKKYGAEWSPTLPFDWEYRVY